MIWFLAISAILFIGLLVVDYHISAPAYKGPESGHFNGKRFLNPDKIRGRGLFDMIKWSITGNRGEWIRLAEHEVDFGSPGHRYGDDIAITFVNHSTFLIEMEGLNLLTDPVWSRRVSPYSWVGPKRMRPPGIRFENLPPIDLVLISHNHYDHLDMETVQRLQQEHDPLFVTPLGVDLLLHRNGITKTADLDWWENHTINEVLNISSVPAQHFSGRGVFDRDKTLWCGYVVESVEGATLYFAGDTAYGSFFTDIGEAFDIDLSLIPIGAYKPRWFMQPIHTDPEEAVHIHRDVQSTRSIGSHFGTFPLADEAMDEPAEDLVAALEEQQVSGESFFIIPEGKTRTFTVQDSRPIAV